MDTYLAHTSTPRVKAMYSILCCNVLGSLSSLPLVILVLCFFMSLEDSLGDIKFMHVDAISNQI